MIGLGAKVLSAIASAAITRRYAVVQSNSTGKVATSSGATDVLCGVAANATSTDGDEVSVVVEGRTEIVVAEAVGYGDILQSNGDGKFKKLVSTGFPRAIAREIGSGDGAVVQADLFLSGVPKA